MPPLIADLLLEFGTAIAARWDQIVIALKGKRLAVLGAHEVGKTHLIKFLTSGSVPAKRKQTSVAEKVPARRFELKELDLKIKDTLDVSGGVAAYGEWKRLHDEADVVFYLLRADRLIVGDVEVESRVRDDLRQIQGWLEAREKAGKAAPHFFIVGTHCDLDSAFAKLSEDQLGGYIDTFCKLPVVKDSITRAGGTQRAKVVLGSTKSLPDIELLVYRIFMQVPM